MRWGFAYLLLIFFIIIPNKSFALVFNRSARYNKIPIQAQEPITKRQVKLFDNPFWFFEENYKIPVRSFNELDILLFNLTSSLDYINEHSHAFKDFGSDYSLSIMNCFEVMSPQWSPEKCWYHISYSDIKKLRDKGLHITDDYVKQLNNVLTYREKLTIKMIALLHRFSSQSSKNFIKDVNDYYGMSKKYNSLIVDYAFRDIHKQYIKNIKYVNSLMNKDYNIIDKKRLSDWLGFLKDYEELSKMPELSIVRTVNKQFSSVRYVSDLDVWGVEDYHATPYELLLKGAGDCEDFAYAKYVTLLSLGFNYDDLSIRYVELPILGAHMVTVFKAENGKEYILDNLKANIYEASQAVFIDSVYEHNLVFIKLLSRGYNEKILVDSVETINSWKQRFLGEANLGDNGQNGS